MNQDGPARGSCKRTTSVGRSVINVSKFTDEKTKLTHVESNLVGMMIVHPKDRRHREDVEENYCELDADINLQGECLITNPGHMPCS